MNVSSYKIIYFIISMIMFKFMTIVFYCCVNLNIARSERSLTWRDGGGGNGKREKRNVAGVTAGTNCVWYWLVV